MISLYPLCVDPLITDLSRELWGIYCATKGLKNETFESIMNMPYIVVNGFQIIQQEVDQIDRVNQNRKDTEDSRRYNQIMNNNNNPKR